MRYVTITELSDIIRRNIWKIPHNIDLVVGVPRSGILPASMIALYLNTNLGDIESLLEDRHFAQGRTRQYMMKHHEIKNILVVDDSVLSGGSMIEIKKKLEPISSKYDFTFLTPISSLYGTQYVDIYLEIIDESRIFEWNLFHHDSLTKACFDLDGVFCCDPKVDDDGEQYIRFLETAEPLFIPTAPIGTIITCRLEKYRKQTEVWLAKYDIKYNELVMLDMPTKAARLKWGKHGDYKGEYFKKSNCNLFIESSYRQALTIAKISHKDVICIETNSIINILSLPKSITKKTKEYIRYNCPKLFQCLKHVCNRIKR
jgi:uncharacterized HAD superfamily protein